MEVDAIPSSPIGSVLVGISLDVSPDGDHVAGLDVEQVEEDVELFAAIRNKINPQKWVNKYESQIGELDQLKLKIADLHGDRDEEAHMTQSVEFITVESVSVDLVG